MTRVIFTIILIAMLFVVSTNSADAKPVMDRPYNIVAVHNFTVKFDDGGCGYADGMPHVGAIGSFWRPDILHFVFSYGFTQDDIVYTFIPTFCTADY